MGLPLTLYPIYTDRPDPIVFLSVTVSTSGHVYDDFVRLLFLHAHREGSILAGELPEKSDQFRFLRDEHLENLNLTNSIGGTVFPRLCRLRIQYSPGFCGTHSKDS